MRSYVLCHALLSLQVSEYYDEPQGTSYFGYTKEDCPGWLEDDLGLDDFGVEIDY